MKNFAIPMVLVATMLGQSSSAKLRKPPARDTSGIDTVIELVQGGAPESVVVKTLRDEGKVYKLLPADVLRLQKAGVSENIINVMMDPKAPVSPPTAKTPDTGPASSVAATPQTAATKDPVPGGAASAPAPPADAGVTTAFPPDFSNGPTTHKRRVVVASFDYGAIKDGAQPISPAQAYWMSLYGQQPGSQSTDDVGQGIRALLMTRLQQSHVLTVLERNAAIEREQQQGLSARNDPGTRAKMGRILGADCIVTGDITIFGRDDKVKKTGAIGGLIPKWRGLGVGGFGKTEKEEKAVVAIVFRIVDSETSAVLLTADARGESTRKDKSLGIEGLGIGGGGAGGGGFQNAMTSSGFEKTILGEATMDAVNKIAQQLEKEIPQLPAKQREIEGRLASITPNGDYLALGANDGVLVGDRFEIRRIDNEVVDPQTKEVIALEAVKVGELVVHEVAGEHAAFGAYGGQSLVQEQLKGKGYQARLMSK